jgi:hypothetical protein
MGGIAKIQKNGETEATVSKLRSGQSLELAGQSLGISDFMIVRRPKAAAAGFAMASEGEVTAALDTRLDEKLKKEGLAREVVNRIQALRKESDLHVSDRIVLGIDAGDSVREAIAEHEFYICKETLCKELIHKESTKSTFESNAFEYSQKVEIESHSCEIFLRVHK